MSIESQMNDLWQEVSKSSTRSGYLFIQGLFIEPNKHPGMVSGDCETWRLPTDDEKRAIKEFIDSMLGVRFKP